MTALSRIAGPATHLAAPAEQPTRVTDDAYRALGLPAPPKGYPPVDTAVSRGFADAALAKIDWSADDIVLYLPGSDSAGVRPAFAQAMRRHPSDRSMSIVAIDHDQTGDMWKTLPVGAATLAHVLDAVAQKKRPGQRVLLGSLSSSSWVSAVTLADPRHAATVDKAVLAAIPGTSRVRHPNLLTREGAEAAREGARIVELNRHNDPITNLIFRGGERARRGVTLIMGERRRPFADVAFGFVTHVDMLGPPAVARALRRLGLKIDNPHDYDAAIYQNQVAGFLRSAAGPASR